MTFSRANLMGGAAAIPLLLGLGVAAAVILPAPGAIATAHAQCNPCAAQKPAANPCTPCAAKNPCAAASPCAAAKAACSPCNACAAQDLKYSCKCFVPRLKQAALANPCAVKKPVSSPPAATATVAACNPCAAKSPCTAANPTAAANPCAVEKTAATPCSPCAAKTPGDSPCAAQATASPYNPCAAEKPKCSPCAAKPACAAANPCAAKPACNPCAAQKAAANPCNPCAVTNPCAAGSTSVELTADEAKAAYDCLYAEMRQAYADTGVPATHDWQGWAAKFNTVPYASATHGARYVSNYSNTTAKAEYGKFGEAKAMPVGSTLIKDSFLVDASGRLAVGPLFIMEKMKSGFDKTTGNWRYYMFNPDGTLFGLTKGKNAAGMDFCHECHQAASDNDFMFFMPEEFRVTSSGE